MKSAERSFQFSIDDELYTFTAEENDSSIEAALAREFPNVKLDVSYCMCYDICGHVNGHFIVTEKWGMEDESKPWIGYRKKYRVRLQIQNYVKGVVVAGDYYHSNQ